MFFCAHAIFYFKLLFRINETFIVHENVYIFFEEDIDAAHSHAEKIAKKHEDLNERGYLEINKEQCAYLFAGIRKLVKIKEHLGSIDAAINFSGEEMTYSVFEVDTMQEVEALAAGKSVDNILYRE